MALEFDNHDELAVFWIRWRAYNYRLSAMFMGREPLPEIAMKHAVIDFNSLLATKGNVPGLTLLGWYSSDIKFYLPSDYELPRRVT